MEENLRPIVPHKRALWGQKMPLISEGLKIHFKLYYTQEEKTRGEKENLKIL